MLTMLTMFDKIHYELKMDSGYRCTVLTKVIQSNGERMLHNAIHYAIIHLFIEIVWALVAYDCTVYIDLFYYIRFIIIRTDSNLLVARNFSDTSQNNSEMAWFKCICSSPHL